ATNWQVMFFVVAAAGFLLMIPIWKLLRDTPEGDVALVGERPSLRKLLSETRNNLREAVRIKGIMIITFSFLAINLTWWGLSLWLPTYLIKARGFSVEEVVWGASLPYLGGIAGMYLGSWISDRTGKRAETAAAFAAIDAALLLLLAATMPHDQVVAVLGMIFFFLGIMAPTAFTLLQGIAPGRLIGSATGFMNGIANGGGVMGPILLGFTVALTSSYDAGLVIMAFFQVVGALLMLSFRRIGRARSKAPQESLT
ncbi:MAG: MFS transporter, partial [Euryarchaeota archaeon]|nr:MFS transporter [Euryarchaeota archaeon]